MSEIEKFLAEYQTEHKDTGFALNFVHLLDATKGIYLEYVHLENLEIQRIENFCKVYKLNYFLTNSHQRIYVNIY
jgi:hypothetical protein